MRIMSFGTRKATRPAAAPMRRSKLKVMHRAEMRGRKRTVAPAGAIAKCCLAFGAHMAMSDISLHFSTPKVRLALPLIAI